MLPADQGWSPVMVWAYMELPLSCPKKSPLLFQLFSCQGCMSPYQTDSVVEHLFCNKSPAFFTNYKGCKRIGEIRNWGTNVSNEVWRDTITKCDVWSWIECWTRNKKERVRWSSLQNLNWAWGLGGNVNFLICLFIWWLHGRVSYGVFRMNETSYHSLLSTGSEKA